MQTNNATFGLTEASAQQLAMVRLRAVEYGRTVVIAATSGISAVVAPDGSVLRRSGLFTADAFDLPIAQRSGLTPAARIGALPEWTATGVGLGALVAAAVAALRRRRAVGERGGPVSSAGAGSDGGGAA